MSFENGMKDILKLKDHNQQSLHREKIAMEKSQDEKAENKKPGKGDAWWCKSWPSPRSKAYEY